MMNKIPDWRELEQWTVYFSCLDWFGLHGQSNLIKGGSTWMLIIMNICIWIHVWHKQKIWDIPYKILIRISPIEKTPWFLSNGLTRIEILSRRIQKELRLDSRGHKKIFTKLTGKRFYLSQPTSLYDPCSHCRDSRREWCVHVAKQIVEFVCGRTGFELMVKMKDVHKAWIRGTYVLGF